MTAKTAANEKTAKSSAAPAHTLSVTDWRIATQGFPALGDGTNRLAVTPKELDKMLTTYAKYAHQALYEALSALLEVSRCNNGCAPGDMTCATNKAEAALALADAAQEGEAKNGSTI